MVFFLNFFGEVFYYMFIEIFFCDVFFFFSVNLEVVEIFVIWVCFYLNFDFLFGRFEGDMLFEF